MKIHSFGMDYKEVQVSEQNTEDGEVRRKGFVEKVPKSKTSLEYHILHDATWKTFLKSSLFKDLGLTKCFRISFPWPYY